MSVNTGQLHENRAGCASLFGLQPIPAHPSPTKVRNSAKVRHATSRRSGLRQAHLRSESVLRSETLVASSSTTERGYLWSLRLD